VIYERCRSKVRDIGKTKYWHRGVYFYPAGLFSRPSSPSNPNVAGMLNRQDLTAVAGHFSFGIHRYVAQPCTYVTVLRDPVSRILSLYDELRAQNRLASKLEEFIVTPPLPEMENDQTRRIAGLDATDPEDHERMLEEAKRNLRIHFAVVGVTERMDETLCLMHRFFRWDQFDFYYPRNVTIKRTEKESVLPQLKQLIADRNNLDVQLHQYAERMLEESIADAGPDFHSEIKKYKESIKILVEQADVDSMEGLDRKQVHQFVLDMINKGKTR
jgi:hypothetical protein